MNSSLKLSVWTRVLENYRYMQRNGFSKEQSGQAMVELSLMMLFLAAILLAMIILAEFTTKNVSALEKIRYEMRVSMDNNAGSDFAYNRKSETVIVEMPGLTGRMLGFPFISQTQSIEYYEGSYQGLSRSIYRIKQLDREIIEKLR